MLPRKNRVGTKSIDEIFRRGKILSSPNLTFKFINTPTQDKKISFIAPKSVAKLAVKRNKLRRLGYSVLKKYINNFPVGLTGVFIFKKYQEDIFTIENEIKNILDKIN